MSYVYLTEYKPIEYRSCLTTYVDHKNIDREIERRIKLAKRNGDTFTYQSYRSILAAERYKLEKSKNQKEHLE